VIINKEGFMRREIVPFGFRKPMSLFDEFDKEFNSMFPSSFNDKEFMPKVDMGEKDGHFWASFDVPGVNKEDLDVKVEHGMVKVSGERNEEKKGDKYSEKYYGKFERSFRVPEQYDVSQLEANYENGVLNLAVPLKAEVKDNAQKIEVKDGKEGIFNKLFS
jgi:HSP20 family protein